MLEQIDLFMTSLNIGVCWYGVAKPKEMLYDGLKYVNTLIQNHAPIKSWLFIMK
jgi:hypothetical protein